MKEQCDPGHHRPRAIVVMGVSGCGKSTLGARLATALACTFLEGDAFHDGAAVAKMRAGKPLTDADRWPWLDRLAAAADAEVRAGRFVVIACSALKRVYRQRLSAAISGPTLFLLLDVPGHELARRMQARPGHYMPPSLLQSQLQTLERPATDEPAVTLDGCLPPETLCAEAMAALGAQEAERAH